MYCDTSVSASVCLTILRTLFIACNAPGDASIKPVDDNELYHTLEESRDNMGTVVSPLSYSGMFSVVHPYIAQVHIIINQFSPAYSPFSFLSSSSLKELLLHGLSWCVFF